MGSLMRSLMRVLCGGLMGKSYAGVLCAGHLHGYLHPEAATWTHGVGCYAGSYALGVMRANVKPHFHKTLP